MAGGDEVRFVPGTDTGELVARLLKLMTAFVSAVPGVPVKVWPKACLTNIPDTMANKTVKSDTLTRRWLCKNMSPLLFVTNRYYSSATMYEREVYCETPS